MLLVKKGPQKLLSVFWAPFIKRKDGNDPLPLNFSTIHGFSHTRFV